MKRVLILGFALLAAFQFASTVGQLADFPPPHPTVSVVAMDFPPPHPSVVNS